MSDLLTEDDPIQIHHWIDRMDAGIDRYERAEFCAWLHRIVDRMEEAEEAKEELAGWKAKALALLVLPFRGRWEAPDGPRTSGFFATKEEATAIFCTAVETFDLERYLNPPIGANP